MGGREGGRTIPTWFGASFSVHDDALSQCLHTTPTYPHTLPFYPHAYMLQILGLNFVLNIIQTELEGYDVDQKGAIDQDL